MTDSLLHGHLSALDLVLLTIGLFVAWELCYRFGRHQRDEARDARKSQADVAVVALLGLLGLLLAFSFGMAADRFDKRKTLVLAEANAIGTAYLRAEMLPPPYDERTEGLLRQYVRARIGLETAEDVDRAIRSSTALHGQLWENAVAAARQTPASPITALFVDSLNRVIDLQEERITVGIYHRIPPAILVTLYLVALLSLAMAGLRAGFDRTRGLAPALILIASVMTVMTLIVSLDEPMSNLFRVDNEAMIDTERMMTGPVAAH